MKRFDDWGSYSNNTFKLHWKDVSRQEEICIFSLYEGLEQMGMSYKSFVSILLNRKSQTAKCLITIGPSTIIYISLSIGRDMYSKTVSFSNFSSDIEGTFQKQIRYACHFVVIYVCKKYEMKFCVLIYHTQIIQALQNCQMYSTFCPRILLLPF